MHSYPKDVTSSTRNKIQNKKNQGDSIQYYFTKIQLKKLTSKDETIYISDKKIICDHTKDGKTSFDSADAGNRKKIN